LQIFGFESYQNNWDLEVAAKISTEPQKKTINWTGVFLVFAKTVNFELKKLINSWNLVEKWAGCKSAEKTTSHSMYSYGDIAKCSEIIFLSEELSTYLNNGGTHTYV